MSTQATRTALEGLGEATSSPLDRNDLGRLARMHSFCQTLAGTEEPADAAARDALRSLAGSLATLLENLILDDAARPDEGMSLIPETVGLIQRAYQGEAVATDEMTARINASLTGEAAPATAVAEPDVSKMSPAPAAPPPEASSEADVQQAAPPPAPAPVEPVVADSDGAAPGGGEIEPYVSEPLTIDLDESEHLQGFIEESREHMDTIEVAVLEVEQDPTNTAKIDELFRPFHTIKGIAGFLNLRDVNRLTHEVETILDMGRKSELRITSTTIDRIFAAVDLLKAQIAEIQSFMANPQGDDCSQPDIVAIMAQLRMIQLGQSPEPPEEKSPSAPKLGEILVANQAAVSREVDEALETQAQEPPPPPKIGEIMVKQGAVSNKQVDSALSEQSTGKVTVADQTLRVETAKLDFLVDSVGELVIAQTMVNLNEAVSGNEKLARNVSQVTKIVRDVQETAMGLRMVPVGATFQKMKRLVRDVSRKANKNVELHISGEDTELDKTVIQRIADPLVHMVRNSVDHGIEAPERRRQAGKPETGNVYLDAYHQGDSIVIEICDDGAGLDSEKLLAKGIERGLVSPEDQLNDQQAFALILNPGFSTAEQVTDISGRGVGMDVVKRNIDDLRGKIEIQSEKGQGTTFFIRLPLTLAIIDGMLIRVGQERLIAPTILIEQSLRPQATQITTVQRRGEMLQVCGELCPLIQLGQLFGYSGRIDPCAALVIIAHCEGQKIGLVVDELIGQQQVVIKSLADDFKHIKGVSGAAILGDGRVGLILEPTGLLRMHNQHRAGVSLLPSVSTSSHTGEVGSSASEQEQEPSKDSGNACCAEPAAASM